MIILLLLKWLMFFIFLSLLWNICLVCLNWILVFIVELFCFGNEYLKNVLLNCIDWLGLWGVLVLSVKLIGLICFFI